MVYFDDTYLPLWPVSDAGLKITAHLYNKSAAKNGGVHGLQINVIGQMLIRHDGGRVGIDQHHLHALLL